MIDAVSAGLTMSQANALFSAYNTLDEIRAMVDHLREHPDAARSKAA